MSKRRHIWHPAGKTTSGKPYPAYCEACGVDKTPAALKAGCRPTRLPGF